MCAGTLKGAKPEVQKKNEETKKNQTKKSGKEKQQAPKNGVGRPRKYKTKKSLETAIEGYFNSISRTVPVLGRGDRPVRNDAGEEMYATEYLRPPTVSGMCLFLGIERSTWQNYCDRKLHPEFAEVTEIAKGRIEAYLEEELVTRDKVQGIMFNLQNNYGWKQKPDREREDEQESGVIVLPPVMEDTE